MLCNAQDVGCNTVIDLGCNNSITLQNVHVCRSVVGGFRHPPRYGRRQPRTEADHSALMPAALTTLPHFSVSAAISRAKSAEVPGSGAPPVSASLAFMAASEKAA